jgi:hypothetical protein
MQITIDDPSTLTAPWTEKFVYTLQADLDRLIHDDFGNDRNESVDGVFTIEPPRP